MKTMIGTQAFASALLPALYNAQESLIERYPGQIWVEITPVSGYAYVSIDAKTPRGLLSVDAFFMLGGDMIGYRFYATIGFCLPASGLCASGDVGSLPPYGQAAEVAANHLAGELDKIVALLMEGRPAEAEMLLAS